MLEIHWLCFAELGGFVALEMAAAQFQREAIRWGHIARNRVGWSDQPAKRSDVSPSIIIQGTGGGIRNIGKRHLATLEAAGEDLDTP